MHAEGSVQILLVDTGVCLFLGQGGPEILSLLNWDLGQWSAGQSKEGHSLYAFLCPPGKRPLLAAGLLSWLRKTGLFRLAASRDRLAGRESIFRFGTPARKKRNIFCSCILETGGGGCACGGGSKIKRVVEPLHGSRLPKPACTAMECLWGRLLGLYRFVRVCRENTGMIQLSSSRAVCDLGHVRRVRLLEPLHTCVCSRCLAFLPMAESRHNIPVAQTLPLCSVLLLLNVTCGCFRAARTWTE